MQDINLPRHVVEALEKKWAERLQQQAAARRTTRTPVRSRTDSGLVIEHQIRRRQPAAVSASTP
ncbi:MAG: hypothetical protein WA702_30300 [Bradyrhizobium sp.]|uniref:hypothetical protein n=1 Tax=Bradyrhizobium sp. TaxID=376 RepID=UPI003C7BC0A0